MNYSGPNFTCGKNTTIVLLYIIFFSTEQNEIQYTRTFYTLRSSIHLKVPCSFCNKGYAILHVELRLFLSSLRQLSILRFSSWEYHEMNPFQAYLFLSRFLLRESIYNMEQNFILKQRIQ